MALAFSELTALAEDVERVELDILRRALDRLEEIDGEPAHQAERQALIWVVKRSVGDLFARGDEACDNPIGGISTLAQPCYPTLENSALQSYISGSSIALDEVR